MNILILTRHYPPIASGGARRPYLFAETLRDAGHTVSVASPAPPGDEPEAAGEQRLWVPHVSPEPPQTVNPLPVPVWQWPLRQWGRELLRWPDPDAAWARRLTRTVQAQLNGRPDWIITTSPPESLLLSGHALKRHYGCRWLADFRDTWLDVPRRTERRLWFRRILERHQGRILLGQADRLCAVDQRVADDIGRIARKPVDILRQLQPRPRRAPRLAPAACVHLVYTGQIAIGDPERTLDMLLDPFFRAQAQNPALRLHICGHLSGEERARLAALPKDSGLTYHGALSLEETLTLQARADALVLLSAPNGWAVPGKYFEYAVTGHRIIAIGEGPWRASTSLAHVSDPVADMAICGPRSDDHDPLAGWSDPARAQLLALIESAG